jgi:hypothetical protein
MIKLLLILLLAYLIFRAGRNLLRAAVMDGLMSEGRPAAEGTRVSEREVVQKGGRQRRSQDDRQIEDAVWEDLP